MIPVQLRPLQLSHITSYLSQTPHYCGQVAIYYCIVVDTMHAHHPVSPAIQTRPQLPE